jgi:hypothetical protein
MVSGNVTLQLNLVNTLIAERREVQEQYKLLNNEIVQIVNQVISDLDLDSQIVSLQVNEEKNEILIDLLLTTSETGENQLLLNEEITTTLKNSINKEDKEIELKIKMIPVISTNIPSY